MAYYNDMNIITFSGVDGSGKSTQSQRVVDALKRGGKNIAYTHANRKLLRDDVKGSDGTYYVYRRRSRITSALIGAKDLLKLWMYLWSCRKAEIIVSDRSIDDTVVKLQFYSGPMPLVAQALLALTPTPVARVWIDVDASVSVVRDNEYPRSYHDAKVAAYRAWFEHHPAHDVIRIDGAEGRDAVTAQILKALNITL